MYFLSLKIGGDTETESSTGYCDEQKSVDPKYGHEPR